MSEKLLVTYIGGAFDGEQDEVEFAPYGYFFKHSKKGNQSYRTLSIQLSYGTSYVYVHSSISSVDVIPRLLESYHKQTQGVSESCEKTT